MPRILTLEGLHQEDTRETVQMAKAIAVLTIGILLWTLLFGGRR